MGSNPTRRQFVKGTVATASAVALSTSGVARGFPANEKVQLGWIGIGSRWRGLANNMLAHCPDARTAAVCDLIPDKVDNGKKVFERDKPAGYTDFRQMMEKEKLDGILVITQPSKHAEVVVPVLEAGFHCFAEKPMDTTVEKVDAIVKAARKAKGFYQIGTQRRYSPMHLEAMRRINGGEFGKVLFMQGEWHWSWRPGTRVVERDGGFLVEQASHHTDVMAWAVGDRAPVSCSSSGRAVIELPDGPNVNNEQQSATAWTFPGGEIFSYTHLTYLPLKFTNEKLWVFCEKAGVDASHGVLYRMSPEERPPGKGDEELIAESAEQFAEDPKGDWGKGTMEELQAFVANVKEGGKRMPTANVETGRVATLMTIMGRMAMINAAKNRFEPSTIQWKDIGTTTDLA
jgi:predicted dehydrogenase